MGRAGRNACDAACLLLLPAALAACAFLHLGGSALLTLLAAVVGLAIFFAGWEKSRPQLRQILPPAVLAAAAVAGRVLFAAAPNIQPVTAICVMSGAAFGKRSGFVTGAVSGLVSSFFLGFGAWTPWQMYAWGLVGYLSGVFLGRLFRECRGPRTPAVVLVFGFLASFLFGFVMNSWTLVGFVRPITWPSALSVYGAGAVFDLMHAASTAVFLSILYVPWSRKLGRISLKYALAE